MDKKLPKLKQANITGITSSELLGSVLSEFSVVVPIPTEKDLGVDMRCELLNEGVPTGLHYNIQCKGTEKLESDRTHFSIQIKVSTINYWMQQREPTFLIVVDRKNMMFYWLYPFEVIKDRLEEIQKQETVTINVIKENKFTNNIKSLPATMINVIYEYHYNLLEKATAVLELQLTEKDDNLVKGSEIEKYISLSSSIEDLLQKVPMLEKLNENLVAKISNIIDKEVDNYWKSIRDLDYMPEVRRYITADSVFDDFGFMNGKTPSMVKNSVDEAWTLYKNNGYKKDDLIKLNKTLEDLFEMNANLAYFLYEMSCESNPLGDYEYIIRNYKM
ncbi:TPA: DUF4365 domain-containing protein [Bacillus paranthracis]|nr:DUF4365 domain-containing protein [Bacillus paranthracis]HDR7306639.1 DUF4365 domain-containing protein [Bacillus paranthracis]